MSAEIKSTNLYCLECGREIKNYYDRNYALISYPFSNDAENKVCIYCAIRIHNAIKSRDKIELGAFFDKELPNLLPLLLRDSQFRDLFYSHVWKFGLFGSLLQSARSYIDLTKSIDNLMINHIYPKYAMDSYLEMTGENLSSIQKILFEYILSLLESASMRITQMDSKYSVKKTRSYRNKSTTLKMTEQEKVLFDAATKECCSLLDEEIRKQLNFKLLFQKSCPKDTDINFFIDHYRNYYSNLNLWYFSSEDKSQCVAVAYPDDLTSEVDSYDWFNTSLNEKYREPRYIFSKEVIERIDFPSDQKTAEMKQAALQTVLENFKEHDASLQAEYQSQLEALEKVFEFDDPWNHAIQEINDSEDQRFREMELEYEYAMSGRKKLDARDIMKHYRRTKLSAFDCIYNESLTLGEKGQLISQFVELQKMICNNQYCLPLGTFDLKPYLYSIKRNYNNKNFFDDTDLISLIIYFHHWRIQKDEASLDRLLGTVYKLFQRKFTFALEQYVDCKPYKYDVPVLSDRLSFFMQINQCCYLLDHYLSDVMYVIERIDEEELEKRKRTWLGKRMPSMAFGKYLSSDEELYSFKHKKVSYEEMRYASLPNMVLIPEIKSDLVERLSKQAKDALCRRMDNIVVDTAVEHIGETLDVVSLMIDTLIILPEAFNCFSKEEEQQILKIRGWLRGQLTKMKEITFVEPEVYEDYLRRHDVNILKEREKSKMQFKIFMGSLELIGSKNVEELMLQRHSFALSFCLDPDMEHNMSMFLDRLTEKIIDGMKDSSSFSERQQKIKNQLTTYPVEIHESVISTLTTAEELYYNYIDGHEPIKGFDYSCISIMYFQALENILNKIIYIPYKAAYLNPNLKDIYLSFKTGRNYNYLPYAKSMSFYFSNFKDENSCSLKEDMTLGSFPFLFLNVGELQPFYSFLQSTFHVRTLDKGMLSDFGNLMRDIAKRRNDSAHGSKVLDAITVKSDRDLIYNENKEESAQIKAAILQFLSMFH